MFSKVVFLAYVALSQTYHFITVSQCLQIRSVLCRNERKLDKSLYLESRIVSIEDCLLLIKNVVLSLYLGKNDICSTAIFKLVFLRLVFLRLV